MPDRTGVAEVCRFLNEEGADYLVVGGFACVFHGILRTTKDLDLLIPRDHENAVRVHRALCRLPLGIAKEHTPSEFIARPFFILGDMPRVDLLLAAGGLTFADAKREETMVDGVRIPFADLDSLLRSKRTGRLQDAADSEALELVRRRRFPGSGGPNSPGHPQ